MNALATMDWRKISFDTLRAKNVLYIFVETNLHKAKTAR